MTSTTNNNLKQKDHFNFPSNSRRNNGAHIAEFGAAFCAFFFFVLIPCINITGFGASYSLASSTTSKTADSLSKSSSLSQIIALAKNTEKNIRKTNAFKIFRLEPSKDPIALDLAIEDLKGVEKIIAISKNPSIKIDRSKNIYRYRITTRFTASPILDLSSVPLIGSIPIIAAPTPIIMTQYREIEHPEYLQTEEEKLSQSF